MSHRIQEGDLFYLGFWILFMGSMVGAVLCLLWRIEKNTR